MVFGQLTQVTLRVTGYSFSSICPFIKQGSQHLISPYLISVLYKTEYSLHIVVVGTTLQVLHLCLEFSVFGCQLLGIGLIELWINDPQALRHLFHLDDLADEPTVPQLNA